MSSPGPAAGQLARFAQHAERIVTASRRPGLPDTLWLGEVAYAPTVRKPGKAVLVFLAHAPETATQPFEVGHEWSRLKVSTFHLLMERQRAAAAVLE